VGHHLVAFEMREAFAAIPYIGNVDDGDHLGKEFPPGSIYGNRPLRSSLSVMR
jgi:hypothetical protein